MIKFCNVNFTYDDDTSFENIHLNIPKGTISFVLGENGSGKTTLLKLILGLISANSGIIEVDGADIAQLTIKQRAKIMAYIPQDHAPVFNLTVKDVILMGCANQLALFGEPNETDCRRAHQIAAELAIDHLLNKGYKKISGGERQLCLIGRALMQTSQLIVMDEPTSNLDFAHKKNFFERCRTLVNNGTTIIISSHQPENAIKYADYVVFMKNHQCYGHGPTKKMMTTAQLTKLYGIDVTVDELACNGVNSNVLE